MNALDLPVVKNLFTLVIDPIVSLIFAAAILYFVYGVFKYIKGADDGEARATGGKHIIWSVVGIFIMISVWGILYFLKNLIGA